jgi:hypothetical protein
MSFARCPNAAPEQNKLLHCCAMLINYLSASTTMDGKSSHYHGWQKFQLPWKAKVSITMDGRSNPSGSPWMAKVPITMGEQSIPP